ncbi:MAG: FecR domain-containing protein [Gemmatimonadaceae bacterium]|nr:FecR domain-containing protein [Gemmatimonadaceae bacterium]
MPPSSAAAADGPPPDWEAIGRLFSGDVTPSEREVLTTWLAAHEPDAAVVGALDETLDRFARAEREARPIDVEQALRAVQARQAKEGVAPPPLRVVHGTATPRRTRWIGVGAGLAAAAALAVMVSRQNGPSDERTGYIAAPTRHTTGVGQRDSIRLVDGTRVVLAPGTTLSVSARYGETERAVSVEGEAWFDVVHDDARPFSVRARHAVVRDIGTQFTVLALPESPVRVVVTQGAVAVRASDSAAEVQLAAGDVASIPEAGQATFSRGAATADDTAWLQDRLVFREAPLPEVTAALARWYGIRLVVDDSTIARRHLTATFADEPRGRVLELLSLALGATIEQRGDTAILRAERR